MIIIIVVGAVYYHPIAIFHYFYGTLLILTDDAVLYLSYWGIFYTMFVRSSSQMEDGYENENLNEYRVWERPLSSEKVARQLLEPAPPSCPFRDCVRQREGY